MMMDCRQVKQLLPLWIGQDLPDAATANDVARHVEQCHECEQRRVGLQASLEVLQSASAGTLNTELARHSVWPKLVTRISEWDQFRHRARFNGWIPASVMAMAVALMIAVSLPSIRDEFFDGDVNTANVDNLFVPTSQLQVSPEFDPSHTTQPEAGKNGTAKGTPVKFRHDQW